MVSIVLNCFTKLAMRYSEFYSVSKAYRIVLNCFTKLAMRYSEFYSVSKAYRIVDKSR